MNEHKGPLLLSARDIVIRFNLRGQILTAIRGASLDVYEGETVAIVGESGSGKSVFTKSFIGMLDQNGRVEGGQLLYHGEDMTCYTTEAQWLKVRGRKIAMVFQDPMTSLNPVRTVGEQIAEVIMWHFGKKHDEARREAIDLLRRVGIDEPERRCRQYPGEFSGGMRQRVVIAAAIACRPEILICDEPTTALDVTVQAQVLNLIKELQRELKMSVVFITHDLGVVAHMADWVAVMYAGQMIEYGEVREIFHQPEHPYTKALLRSLPQLGVKGHDLYAIHGTPPSLFKEIQGDAFAPRNADAMKIDFLEEPPAFQVSPTHWARTWLLAPEAGAFRAALAKRDAERRSRQTPAEPFDYSQAETLLSVRNLSVHFKLGSTRLQAVDHVSFDIYKGETLSLVGESGSGKTTIGRAVMSIHSSNVEGDIVFKGRRINEKLSKKERGRLHMEMQMIFQDPMASLNDRAKVDYIVSEGLYNYRLFDNEADRVAKVERILQEVGLTSDFMTRFPHEFSGGQRQRIGIARSLIMNPELVVADEPISALDVSIRAQVINLLNRLKKERGLTYLFIAHDLSAVRFISDRIAVIYKGRLVELAACEELFARPLHPYTRALLSAAPYPDPDVERGKAVRSYHPDAEELARPGRAWAEIYPFHYVFATEEEAEAYRHEAENA
ncbi:MAG: ABC transporter ATP-binding protein [Clostridia bacterium]|nr:ABC transporter ATP-binding protein [Clostridia bacterium]MBO4884200.1 ABC transporter ATP-binding protein [Clostridia bacterium]